MPEQPTPPRRKKTVRLQGHDYRQAGTYFVTLCILGRRPVFGTVHDHAMHLNPIGEMVTEVLATTMDRYPGTWIDTAVIMPDHLHLIIMLGVDPEIPAIPALGDVVRYIKGQSTLRYIDGVKTRDWPPFSGHLWQRQYHDRIVRTEVELGQIRDYIQTNPERWWMRQLEERTDTRSVPTVQPEDGEASRYLINDA